MSADRKRTKTEERHLAHTIDSLEALQIEMQLRERKHSLIPQGWYGAHSRTPCGPSKKKMTIRLDADVMDWYRGLGAGYQRRINEVLKAYMHAILSKLIEQPGDRDWLDRPL